MKAEKRKGKRVSDSPPLRNLGAKAGLPEDSSETAQDLPAGIARLLAQLRDTQDELRRTREELRETRVEAQTHRARYYDLFDHAPGAYIVTDTNGVVLECNRAASEMLDRSTAQVTGKPLPVFFSLADRPAFRQLLNSFHESEQRQECELRLSPHRGTEPLYAQATVSVVRDVVGAGTELRWMLRDVTRRKRAEAALALSEARHRFLTEHAQDAIYLYYLVPEFRLDHISPAISDLTGYAPEDFYRDPTLLRKLVHPDDQSLIDELMTNPEAVESPVTMRLLHKSGKAVWAEHRATMVRDAEGKPVMLEAIIRDVTERVRTEEQLEKLRTEFLFVLAHELRTPLTAIKGSSSIGLSGETPPTQREAHELFKIIDEQADRLRQFVSSILDVTQIEAGLLSLKPEKVQPEALVNDARAALAKEGMPHKVLVELPEDLPRLKADKRRVVQVLSNLLSNAAHVSPPTEAITVTAEREEDAVTFRVCDRGRGIAPDKLPLLFRKFYKIDERADKGSGLGLAISKGIVEAHGGRIWAESAGEGAGASFSFTLPAA